MVLSVVIPLESDGWTAVIRLPKELIGDVTQSQWFKHTFAENEDFTELLEGIERIPVGANGLVFTPYLVGERTSHADPSIRASFIGMESAHTKKDFVRAVLEGITFSLNESIHIFRESGKKIDTIISIGGGAKNETWLQMLGDIFNAKILKLSSEQGPGMGQLCLRHMDVAGLNH